MYIFTECYSTVRISVDSAWYVTIALSNTINGRYAYHSVDVPRSTGYQPAGDNGARAGASRMRAPPLPATPARSHNGKRLGAHVISESESVTHFPAIQVYVSARSRGCATERVEDGAGGGPLTQLRAVPQQGRVAANIKLMFTFVLHSIMSYARSMQW